MKAIETKKDYQEYVDKMTPNSNIGFNIILSHQVAIPLHTAS